jgi:hypothetical protein
MSHFPTITCMRQHRRISAKGISRQNEGACIDGCGRGPFSRSSNVPGGDPGFDRSPPPSLIYQRNETAQRTFRKDFEQGQNVYPQLIFVLKLTHTPCVRSGAGGICRSGFQDGMKTDTCTSHISPRRRHTGTLSVSGDYVLLPAASEGASQAIGRGRRMPGADEASTSRTRALSSASEHDSKRASVSTPTGRRR